jgi:DNA-binding response OmpR family regulator
MAWIDRINFDKVVSNLLSNAFKFTFDGGEVKVVLSETETDITLQVIDTGVGIQPEDASHVFDRFYQGRNADDMGMQGTGIGLNLCKAITEMHHGEISAKEREDGLQGSCFTVVLLKGNAHLKPEEIVVDTPAREVLSSGDKRQFRQFHVLIVDDDQEIADYINNELGNHYKFDHAPNGKEALKILLTQQYDLVISDVMMPEMDGLTLLKRIKDNPQISQIPVIMLTSKAEAEHKLEGLKSGADAYIAKPFSMEELHIQIDNLIDKVRRLRGEFSGAMQQEERVEKIQVKGNDDALMERVMHSINANLSDPEFNIDTLAADVGISRAQLHRKMKEITGISSGKFLRNLRMEQAARLLRESKVNVSQVAFKVGYTDQAHFSTAFKTHFGMSPSEYIETHRSSILQEQ